MKQSINKLKSNGSSDQLPVIKNNPESLFKRNRIDTKDDRFTSYFQNKYSNSQNIMQTFQKTLSNYSFLGLKLSEKPKTSFITKGDSKDLFLDNYIGHTHNKKPTSSQSSCRTKSSSSRFRMNNMLDISLTQQPKQFDIKNSYELLLMNIENLIENLDRLTLFLEITKLSVAKNNLMLSSLNEYWEFINGLGLDNLIMDFLENDNKNIIKKALLYEMIYIALIHFFYNMKINENSNRNDVFLTKLQKIYHFIYQNYLLYLALIYHLTKHIPKAMKLPIFHTLCEILSKKLLVYNFNDTLKTIKYNNKVLDNYNKEFLHLLLLNNTKFFQITKLFQIFEYFLITDVTQIDIKDMKIQISQALTKILKPLGFFSEKDQMKEIFLTGTFATLNIDQMDLDMESKEIPDTPFLPPNDSNKSSLILELEGVLINSIINEDNELAFKKRPGLDIFLKDMSQSYEIIIFSTGSREFVEKTLEVIDSGKIINYHLHKDYLIKSNNVFVKDLSLLGRDLRRVISVDCCVESFQLQQENGIFIKKWDGDLNDESLKNLGSLLKHFAAQNFKDLRKVLINYRDQAIRLLWNGVKVELI